MVNATACLGCFSFCFFVILAVGLGLFGASFAVVDYNQAALKKNKFSVKIDSTNIYMAGRYPSYQAQQSHYLLVISSVLQDLSLNTIQHGRPLSFQAILIQVSSMLSSVLSIPLLSRFWINQCQNIRECCS